MAIELRNVVNALTEDTSPDVSADFVITYDSSVSDLKKAKLRNLIGDGDKGDITVSNNGLTWTIDNSAVTNAKLQNSSLTVNGTAISLGGSGTVTAANPNALTIGTGLSGTSYNGSSAVTIAVDSTVATLTGSQALSNKTYNGLTLTSTTGTFTLTNAKTLTVQNTLTFSGTDSSSVAFGAGGTVAYTSNKLSVFAATTSSELAGVISDETGSGALVFGTSPSLTTPTIGGAGANFSGSTSGSLNLRAAAAAGTGVTVTIPATTGTVVTSGDTGTVTNTMLAGSIANNKLTNSSVTVNGTAISLGSSGTVTANTSNALTIGTGLSGTSFNGSSAVTIAIDSTVGTLTGTQTFTNKRINPRVVSVASSTSITIDDNVTDMYEVTDLAAATTFNATSGTPVNGQKLLIRIKDNNSASAPWTITWTSGSAKSFAAGGVALPTTTVKNKWMHLGFVYNTTTSRWQLIASAVEA